MSKKLMLLVAGALMALAFTALAGTAAAKETKLKCEGTGLCTYTSTSGPTNFSIINGDTVLCEHSTGTGEVTNLDAERESTTSTSEITFEGCHEQNTIFHFACSNTGTAGKITTNVMTVHNIALPGTPNGAGVLLTNAGVTFTCAGGFAATQVTGSIIGEFEHACNTHTGTVQEIEFLKTSHGVQKDKAYTGVNYDLEGKTNHSSGGTYETSAQEGTGVLTFNQNVTLTCA